MGTVYVGCAGWNIPSDQKDKFSLSGTQLERYAGLFPAVEINSSFYRPHRRSTYAKWKNAVPAEFRFTVKAPKAVTHAQLLRTSDGMAEFFDQVSGLDEKLGAVLFQLPPKLEFEPSPV